MYLLYNVVLQHDLATGPTQFISDNKVFFRSYLLNFHKWENTRRSLQFN